MKSDDFFPPKMLMTLQVFFKGPHVSFINPIILVFAINTLQTFHTYQKTIYRKRHQALEISAGRFWLLARSLEFQLVRSSQKILVKFPQSSVIFRNSTSSEFLPNYSLSSWRKLYRRSSTSHYLFLMRGCAENPPIFIGNRPQKLNFLIFLIFHENSKISN